MTYAEELISEEENKCIEWLSMLKDKFVDTKYERFLAIAIDAIKKQKMDGCCECAYESRREWQVPCKDCRRAHRDYWRTKDHEI